MSPDIAECMLHLIEMDTGHTPDKNSFDVQDALLFTLLLAGRPRTFCPHSTLTDIQSTGNVSSAFARPPLSIAILWQTLFDMIELGIFICLGPIC